MVDTHVQAHESSATPPTQSAFSDPVRILIVDDDMDSADSLERMLHASGYSETRVVYSGEAALAASAEFQPGVVLLEINLPDMSGYEVAQLLHEHAQLRDVRLIALTASREHAGRDLARAAGFERYLRKPVEALALVELLGMQPQ
jgi:CheY-like chemotaxis protein